MTRKDYALIAATIKETALFTENYPLELLARKMAEALKKDNPRFDTQRFMEACGWAY